MRLSTAARRRAVRTRGPVVGTLAAVLLLTGCGSSLSHERLLQDAAGTYGGTAAGTLPGAVAAGGGDPGAADGDASTGQGGTGGTGAAAGTTGADTAGGTTGGSTGGGTTGGSTGGSAGGRATTGDGGGGTGGTVAAGTGGTTGGAPGAPKPGGSPADGESTTASCTGTKSTIVIGAVGQLTGALGTAFVGGNKAVSAWVASVNQAGGLGCHPVKYITADDGGDPSRHLSLVRQLVEQDKVIAMVHQPALLTGQASESYVKSKGIPVIGQEGGELQTYDSPVFFNHATAGNALIDFTLVAGAKAALAAGKTKVGTLTCQEVSYCNTADKRWAALAPGVGFKAVYRGQASLVNVDFTSQCLAARDAGAQALAVAFDSTGIHRIAQSCASVGYKPLIICTSVQSNLDFQDDANLKGAVVALNVLPWFLDKEPAVQKYQSTLKKFAPGLAIDASSMNGWAAAQLFAQAKSAFAEDTVTSAGIIKSLAGVKDNDLGGLTYPLSFAPGKPQVAKTCGWVVVTGSKSFSSDGKRFCR
ncbi:MAG: hypothetical protein JWM64_946 [Frankiales bacterium]|nr:hypothetical protein [Frankiales bacterium]